MGGEAEEEEDEDLAGLGNFGVNNKKVATKFAGAAATAGDEDEMDAAHMAITEADLEGIVDTLSDGACGG